MARPTLAPAAGVSAPAAVFRDWWENPCPFRPVQHALTGLIVLPNTRLASLARGILDRAEKTTRWRGFAAAPGRADESPGRRIRCMRHQTNPQRRRRRASLRASDATRGEHGGRLWAEVDRRDPQRDGPSPLAPEPATSVAVRGPGRGPGGLRLARRDAALTPWDAAVAQPWPAVTIPPANTARPRLHQPGALVWLQAPPCRARQAPCQPTLALAIAWVEAALRATGPLGGRGVDAWSLAEDVGPVWARRRQNGSRRLHTNRRLATASVHRREAQGGTRPRPRPHRAVAEGVPLRHGAA